MSSTLAIVFAVSLLAPACFAPSAVKVDTPAAAPQTGQHGWPDLPDPAYQKYLARFLEDKKRFEARPESIFEVGEGTPCELSPEARKQFLPGQIKWTDFRLLSGECHGGNISGDVRFYTRAEIAGGTIIENISSGQYEDNHLQGEGVAYTKSLSKYSKKIEKVSFYYGIREHYSPSQVSVVFEADYKQKADSTTMIEHLKDDASHFISFNGPNKVHSAYYNKTSQLHGEAVSFKTEFSPETKLCYVYGQDAKPEDCYQGLPTDKALVTYQAYKPAETKAPAKTPAAVPQRQAGTRREIIAVFDIEARRVKFDRGFTDTLSDYLTNRLTEAGRYQVLPRSQIKERLLGETKNSYKACYDQSCQIELGRELAAQKTLSTIIQKLGSKCKVSAAVYDLKKAATSTAATASSPCTEDGLVKALDQVVEKISRL